MGAGIALAVVLVVMLVAFVGGLLIALFGWLFRRRLRFATPAALVMGGALSLQSLRAAALSIVDSAISAALVAVVKQRRSAATSWRWRLAIGLERRRAAREAAEALATPDRGVTKLALTLLARPAPGALVMGTLVLLSGAALGACASQRLARVSAGRADRRCGPGAGREGGLGCMRGVRSARHLLWRYPHRHRGRRRKAVRQRRVLRLGGVVCLDVGPGHRTPAMGPTDRAQRG